MMFMESHGTRGVSPIVGVALLILVTVGLSAGVYSAMSDVARTEQRPSSVSVDTHLDEYTGHLTTEYTGGDGVALNTTELVVTTKSGRTVRLTNISTADGSFTAVGDAALLSETTLTGTYDRGETSELEAGETVVVELNRSKLGPGDDVTVFVETEGASSMATADVSDSYPASVTVVNKSDSDTPDTVQAGVQAASVDGTVYVQSASTAYTGGVVVNKSVTLHGEVGTILAGNLSCEYTRCAVQVSADGVRLKQLTIEAPDSSSSNASAGIEVVSQLGTGIDSVTIHGPGDGVGVYARGANQTSISHSRIHNVKWGALYVGDAKRLSVVESRIQSTNSSVWIGHIAQDVTIARNSLTGGESGVRIEGGSNMSVTSNEISHVSHGVYAKDAPSNSGLLDDLNLVLSSTSSVGSRHIRVTDNNITHVSESGIHVDNSDDLRVSWNSVTFGSQTNTTGILINNSTGSLRVYRNALIGYETGVHFRVCDTGDIVATYNDWESDGTGQVDLAANSTTNGTSYDVDGTSNWWGQETGASSAEYNGTVNTSDPLSGRPTAGAR